MAQIINNKGNIGKQTNLDCKSLDELIEEAMIDNGFKKEDKFYTKNGYPKIKHNTNLKYFFESLIKAGKTSKVWELKKSLEIID